MSNQDAIEGRRDVATQPLLIFPGALGDFICFLPALAEIRKRVATLPRLLCKQSLASLVSVSGLAEPEPIEARPVSWLFSPSPPIEAERYFSAFVSIDSFTGFGNPEVDRNLARWVGSRGRVHPFRPNGGIHLAFHFLDCIGASRDRSIEPALPLPETMLDRGRKILAPLSSRRPILVAHPGSGGRGKRWSRQGFVELAEQWQRRHGAALIVLGPAEKLERSDWAAHPFSVESNLDLLELAAVLALGDVYLGNDSGASHLAGAVGAFGAVLFGPSDPTCWRPLSPRLRAVRLEPWTAVEDPPSPRAIQSVRRELTRITSSRSP